LFYEFFLNLKFKLNMTFRLAARNVFLTYPRCDISPREMGEHLKTVFDCKYILVVQEEHNDEEEGPDIGVHLHCLLMGNRKHDIKRESWFDYRDFHPNIQKVKKPEDCFNYCLKGYLDKFEDGDRTCVSPEELHRELFTCRSELELLQMIDNKKLAHKWQMYRKMWQLNRQRVDEAPVRSLDEFDVPVLVREWMADHDNRSLILVGTAGTGKTSMARALATELGDVFWCPHRERLAAYAGEATILFDDTDFAGCGRTTLLNYVDMEQNREFRVLYGSVSVPHGVRRIFTTNSLEYLLGEHQYRPEIERRIRVVRIDRPLYGRGDGDVGPHPDEARRTADVPEAERGPGMVCRLLTRS
jgi:hypothetical protein